MFGLINCSYIFLNSYFVLDWNWKIRISLIKYLALVPKDENSFEDIDYKKIIDAEMRQCGKRSAKKWEIEKKRRED